MIINPHAGSIKPLSEGFNELTGATVEGVKVPYDQITAQSTLDVMSGTNEMDVFQYWYVDKEALVRDGVLADITDRIAAEEADIDPADFLGSLYDAYTLVDGRRYGLPYDGDTHVLFYNKEILDRNGLAPPATWDEYNAVAKAVTDAEAANRRLRRPAHVQAVPESSSARPTRTGWVATAATSSMPTARRRSRAMPPSARHRRCSRPAPLRCRRRWRPSSATSIPVFLSGGAAMIEFWTDLGTWAQDASQSQIVDKWGVVPMPVAGSNTVKPACDERGLVLRRLIGLAQSRDGVGVRAHAVEQGISRARADRQHDRRGSDAALCDAGLPGIRAAAGGRRGAGHRRRPSPGRRSRNRPSSCSRSPTSSA